MGTRVLFCTAAGERYGLGHLKRCLSIINEAGVTFEPSIYIVKGSARDVWENQTLTQGYRYVRTVEEAERPEIILCDMRNSRGRQMRKFAKAGTVVSLDDLGAAKKYAHILLHTLPTLEGTSSNLSGSDFLVLESKLKRLRPLSFSEKRGVLVSFGGSDPDNLTGFIVPMLNFMGIQPTVIRGPLFSHRSEELKGEILENPKNLHELINRAQVLITSFGITMFEAFFLGTPVILFNRSSYHYRLAQKVPAMNLGYKGSLGDEQLKNILGSLLEDEQSLRESAQRAVSTIDGRGTERVISLMNQGSHALRKDCLFGHSRAIALKRNEEYTLFRCRRCGDFFLYEIQPLRRIYDDSSYFLSEYKKQYGRTYPEDRENIDRIGVRRIKIIEGILEKPGRMLDVGCALGFFVHLAASRGWEALGIEVSPYACEWGKKILTLDITQASFLDVQIEAESFDAVCFFFVAEHFKNIEDLIEKTHRILKKGGVVAFALPNRSGISYRLRRQKYLETHPRDHYFDTNPKNLTRILKRYGFRKRNIYITGIHPNRFFEAFGIRSTPRFLQRVYSICANIFHLGDTFEYYGTKT